MLYSETNIIPIPKPDKDYKKTTDSVLLMNINAKTSTKY